MRDRPSHLEAMNAGRRRRAAIALDQLDATLDRLEGRRDPATAGDRREQPPVPHADDGFGHRLGHHDTSLHENDRRHIARPGHSREAGPARDHDRIAAEMRALREELHHQMNGGLHREFAALRGQIEQALATTRTAPAGQAAELGAEFERLSSTMVQLAEKNDDRQLQLLRLEMEEMRKALGQLAREETVRSFDRRFSDMAGRTEAPRAAPDPALGALAARIEEIGGTLRALPTSAALRALEDRIQVLHAAVDRFSRQPQQPGTAVLDAIEERLDEISRAVAASAGLPRAAAFDPEPFERLEARITSLARQIGEATQESASRDLSDQLAALSHRVEDLAHRVDLPERAVERLAGQIGAIADRLDHAPALPNLDAVFHGLENRIASLAGLLEQRQEDALAQGRALFHDLESRIDDVAARIGNERPASGGDDQFIAAMDARFAELAARFERQAAAPAGDDSALRELERRLDTISDRIEASAGVPAVDAGLIRSLESQIADLAAHISRPVAAEAREDITPRLERIERSIAESRSDVLEAARRAAEEAAGKFSGSAAEGELVAGLAGDLKALEALTRRCDDRNARTFEAIHDTLLKIVDRLGTLESARGAGTTDAPSSAVAAREVVLGSAHTPSLAPADEALPPEPAATALATIAAAQEVQAPSAAQAAPGRASLLGGLARVLARGKAARPEAKSKEADRAGMVETAPATAEEVAPADPGAALDPNFANRPLEPGSGGPDLNAIMRRVRDERSRPMRELGPDASQADFIAAARRAAQAAAAEAEAEAIRHKPASAAAKRKVSAAGGRRVRKPLLMGIAAVLFALAALQGARLFLSGDQAAQPAAPIAALSQQDSVEAPSSPARMAETAAPVAGGLPGEDAATLDDDAGDAGWLDMETTAAAPAQPAGAPVQEADAFPQASQPVHDDIAEMEAMPEPDEAVLAAIPLDAGPVALREAAAAGDPKALYEIGNRYAEGRGVAEDMAAAARWYEQAARHGLAPAQYRLGSFYEKGIGVARDIAEARRWYRQAAESGNASAMHNLAVLHAMGAEGDADNEAASRWFLRAAELGVRDSQFNLGILSAKGVGMEQNLQEAYKWFALVAKAGDKDAAEKRDEIARALRPEQLETARAAAELWRARELDAEANSVEIPESWSESAGTTAGVDMRAAVRNIQQILNRNGYQAGTEDGLMGQKTKNAIAAFQKDNGMEATGEVDEALVRALLDTR